MVYSPQLKTLILKFSKDLSSTKQNYFLEFRFCLEIDSDDQGITPSKKSPQKKNPIPQKSLYTKINLKIWIKKNDPFSITNTSFLTGRSDQYYIKTKTLKVYKKSEGNKNRKRKLSKIRLRVTKERRTLELATKKNEILKRIMRSYLILNLRFRYVKGKVKNRNPKLDKAEVKWLLSVSATRWSLVAFGREGVSLIRNLTAARALCMRKVFFLENK